MLTPVLIFIVTFLICTYIFHGRSKFAPNFPPGPVGLPVIGCLHKIAPKPSIAFMRWAGKYGDVFGVHLGTRRVVVINGYDAVREALNRYRLSGRPLMWIWVYLFDNKGMNSNKWSVWKEQRRLALHGLRDSGMGKRAMEERISSECDELLKAIGKENGKPFDPWAYFHSSTFNVLVAVSFGKRKEYDDPEFRLLLERALALTQVGIMGILASFFPVLFKLSLKFLGLKPLRESVVLMREYMEDKIEERKKLMDNEPECFIDFYLQKIRSSTSSDEEPDLTHLPYVLMEFMLGGSDTTATTLRWCLVYMLRNPEIQGKIRAEIDECCDRDGKIEYASRVNMPYTEAFILETQRISTLFPIGVSRRAMEDTHLKGNFISKDTRVITNLWSAQRDPRVWKNPDKFDPYRFLNDKGNEVINREKVLAFGLGARLCIGAQIARVELFLILTRLLKDFEITTPDGEPPSDEGLHAITYTPLPFKIIAKSRNK